MAPSRSQSSIEPPTALASAAALMARAAFSGECPWPFSRSTETGSSVAAAITRVWSITWSSVTPPSSLPTVKANPPLVVANALNPSDPSTLAEPASQGFGITNGSSSCRARKAAPLSSWVTPASLARARLRLMALVGAPLR